MKFKMKKLLYIFFVALSISTKAQEIPTLENYSLKNGLKVYFIKYGKIEAINVSVVINSGKKNETPGQQGYNSLIANLILQGNKKYSEEIQDDKCFAIGAELEAKSNYDRTYIEGNFLSKDAATAIDLMSAAIKEPLFDKDKVAQYVSYTIDYNIPAKMDIAKNAQDRKSVV